MKVTEYNREAAVKYANRWALSRNPIYYNFEELGGDCTNFVSQCLFAGSNIMNFSSHNGWYYRSLNERSPSWTGVMFLREYLLTNTAAGVFAHEEPLSKVEIGDVIQLGKNEDYYHSLFVTEVGYPLTMSNILVNAHTDDAYKRRLSTYFGYDRLSLLHIQGVSGALR
jgi:hypothetical protein